METAGGSVAITRLSLLPEFSTSTTEPVWVEEMLVIVSDSTVDCESVSEVSISGA